MHIRYCLFAATALSFVGSDVCAGTYSFVNVVDSSFAAPAGTFDTIRIPSIDGNMVVFLGNYSDPITQNSEYAVFAWKANSLTVVAKTGDVTPLGNLWPAFWSDPTVSDGTIAFRSYVRSADGTYMSPVIFLADGGGLIPIAIDGGGTFYGTLSNEFGSPAISGGKTAFAAGFRNDKKAILVNDGVQTTSIVMTGDPAPNGVFGYGGFSDPAISDGKVAFRASGILVGAGGSLTTVALTGDVAPNGTFNSFGLPSLSGDTAVFFGSYTGGHGIFKGNGGALETIVKTGDAAPVSGTFSTFGGSSIANDEVAFLGLGTFPSGRAIFALDEGGLTQVIGNGDSLFGSTVVNLEFGRFGLDSAGTGALAFRYLLEDGTFGVAIAIPVPEPESLFPVGLVLLPALFVVRCRAAKN